MNEETSRIIVAVVLILGIIISSYLTSIAFKYRSTLKEDQRVRNTVQSAEVTLTVLPPEVVEEPEGDIVNEAGAV